MPKPLYLICSQHALENKETGLFSLVEIIEKLVLTPVPQPQSGQQVVFIPWHPFKATATWMMTSDENDACEYEMEWSIIQTSGEPIPNLFPPPRLVKLNRSRPIWRNVVNFMTPFPIDGPGLLRVICRIRLVGSDDWLSQECPIIIEQVPSLTPTSGNGQTQPP